MFVDDDHTYAGGNPKSGVVAADPLAGLDHLAREVAASGITQVEGDVLVDDRRFEAASSTGSGPSRVGPVMLNDNVVDVLATPADQPGRPARVRLVPETSYVTTDSRVETIAEGGETVLSALGGSAPVARARRVPVGHAPVLRVVEVDDPASFARSAFLDKLAERGVRVEASALADNPIEKLPSQSVVASLPKVAAYTSPPLREYLRVILKVSHNLHASTLPLLIAAHHGETKLSQGLAREGAILKGLGVSPSAVSFGGGAGGSRSDLVSPRATVSLLRALAARADFPAFEAALPVLGRDGTLARRRPR